MKNPRQNWKKYFHQFYVDDILIIPSWEDVKPSDEDKMVIHIDPGTAFGTGMHETTQHNFVSVRSESIQQRRQRFLTWDAEAEFLECLH